MYLILLHKPALLPKFFQIDFENKTFCHFPQVKKFCFIIKQEKLNEYKEKLERVLTEF